MPQEIERKFLVNQEQWDKIKILNNLKPLHLVQGYLNQIPKGQLHHQEQESNQSQNKLLTIRVRIQNTEAFLTIKSRPIKGSIKRMEMEYPIPLQDAKELLKTTEVKIEKFRYLYLYEGHTFEIDEFQGKNQGLTVAEIELENEMESFSKPSFLTTEVSHDASYLNENLAHFSFNSKKNKI